MPACGKTRGKLSSRPNALLALLLDTHILVRWVSDNRRLSRRQIAVIEAAQQRSEPLALSPITLLEIAYLVSSEKLALKSSLSDSFDDLRGNPLFVLLPLSYEVASEIALLAQLRDPSDRAIVATARVHHLRLVTSDERIIDSRLVPVIE